MELLWYGMAGHLLCHSGASLEFGRHCTTQSSNGGHRVINPNGSHRELVEEQFYNDRSCRVIYVDERLLRESHKTDFKVLLQSQTWRNAVTG
mgnify:FL=1